MMSKDINCLEYALRFWSKNPDYPIYYDGDHAINLHKSYKAVVFLPLEDYGYDNITRSFQSILSKEAKVILKEYFNI